MNIEETLYNNAEDKMGMDVFKAIDIGMETGITYPMMEFIVSNPFMQDPYLAEIASVNNEIWRNLDQFPEWKEFILEAVSAREALGIKSPVSPLSVAILIIESNPELEARINELLGMQYFDQNEVIVDADNIIKLFNYLLNDPIYRNVLRNRIVDFMYYTSSSYVDNYEVGQFIREQGLESPIILDMGCGYGGSTQKLYKSDGRRVIGVDRQYYEATFAENWRDLNPGIEFVQADGQALPLPNESIDYAVATSVFGHLNEEAIAEMVKEATRVVKVGGYFIVGPQSGVGNKMYRYFRKSIEGVLEEVA